MKVAIYGDVHLTRKMGNLQSVWDDSAVKIFNDMYRKFNEDDIELAVCLGDFFDQPRIEAKSVKVVTKVLSIINSNPGNIPTFFLLGNHEIYDDESNILDYLSEYDNIVPVTTLMNYQGKVFIPYNHKIEDVSISYIRDHYIFTHHDIYGSRLAGGKVTANFGIDPAILSSAKRVFNGHIHLASDFGNIHNVGSLLKSNQGELSAREIDYPRYLYLDTETDEVKEHWVREYFIAPLTLRPQEIDFALSQYDPSVKVLLRVLYDNDQQVMNGDSLKDPRILRVSYKKSVGNFVDNIEEDYQRRNFLDVKDLISNYIQKDSSIHEEDKPRITELSLSMLEV